MGKRFNGRVCARRLGSVFAFCLLALGVGALAGSDLAAAGSPQPDPSITIPEGSTLVPSRAEFDKALGIGTSTATETTPQSVTTGTTCGPNFGSPSTGPSYVEGAVGVTQGVVVSQVGYLIYRKSATYLAPDCLGTYSPWSDLFGTGKTYSEARVVWDAHIHAFVLAVLSADDTTGDRDLNFAFYSESPNPADAPATPTVSTDSPFYTADSSVTVSKLSLGYAAGYVLFTVDLKVGAIPTTGSAIRYDGTNVFQLHPLPAGSVAPLILDGATTAYFLAVDTSSGSQIKRTAIELDNFGSANSDTITVPAFAAPPAVVQNNGATLNAGDGSFVSPTYQFGNSLWNVHTVNVDGHARVQLYKFSTTGTAPLMTFTPTAFGDEDFFNPSMATSSDAAGTKAFISATFTRGTNFIGQKLAVFQGPNDSTQGWSWDSKAASSKEYTPCPTEGCAWGPHSGTAIDPADTSGATAWTFNQAAIDTAEKNWGVLGFQVTAPGGAGLPPIASAATDVGSDHFTANWSTQPPAVGYQLDVATDAAFTSFVSGFQAKDVGNVTSFAVTGLSQTTTYYYRVRAVGSGTSLNSNTIAVTTLAVPACTLTASPDSISSGGSSTLTWTSANATSASMDNSVGSLTPVAGGTVSVSPTNTTTYIATFTGPGGSTTCTALVTIPGTTAIGPLELLGLSLLAFAGLGLRMRRA